jgi:GNAT superfamily N-acetyltransferase
VSAFAATEPFDRTRHRVDSLGCGHETLDRWLRAYAAQAQHRDAARTFVTAEADGTVAGYYTLVAAQVRHQAATTGVARGVSRQYPIPVALLARLAVDRRRQSEGLGRSLLLDALLRVIRASEELAVRAITVDAIDARAAAFYGHFGFEPSPLAPGTLMVSLESARQVLGAA